MCFFQKHFETVTSSKIWQKISSKLAEKLAKACTDVCEGQMLDIGMANAIIQNCRLYAIVHLSAVFSYLFYASRQKPPFVPREMFLDC